MKKKISLIPIHVLTWLRSRCCEVDLGMCVNDVKEDKKNRCLITINNNLNLCLMCPSISYRKSFISFQLLLLLSPLLVLTLKQYLLLFLVVISCCCFPLFEIEYAQFISGEYQKISKRYKK